MTAHFVCATPDTRLCGLPFSVHRENEDARTGQFASDVQVDPSGNDYVDVVFDGDGHQVTRVSAREMGIIAENDGATYTLVNVAGVPAAA